MANKVVRLASSEEDVLRAILACVECSQSRASLIAVWQCAKKVFGNGSLQLEEITSACVSKQALFDRLAELEKAQKLLIQAETA